MTARNLHIATQALLANPHLNTSGLKIDGRTREQLFVMLYKLSKQFWYYNASGAKEGDWRAFFESDLTSVLIIQGQDHKQEEFGQLIYLIEAAKRGSTNKAGFLKNFLETWVSTITELSKRYQTLTKYFYRHPFQVFLHDLIAGHLGPLTNQIWQLFVGQNLGDLLKEYEWIQTNYQRLTELPVAWGFGAQSNAGAVFIHLLAEDSNLDKSFDQLIKVSRGFYKAYETIVQKADQSARVALEAGNTQPHIALILAFLKLYGHQQNLINKLPERYLEFYYQKVLAFKPQGIKPDEAFVLMSLNDQTDFLDLEKGTLLSAVETEEGDSITFETIEEARLSSAKLTKLSLVNSAGVHKNIEHFQQPQTSEATGRLETFSIVNHNQKPPVVKLPEVSGFAISSPDLYLSGGQRCFKLTLSGLDKEQRQSIGLGGKCKLLLTTETGWHAVAFNEKIKIKSCSEPDPCKASSESKNDCNGGVPRVTESGWNGQIRGSKLALKVELDLDVPPIVYYDEEVHGEGYKNQWPLLRFEFAQGLEQKERIDLTVSCLHGEVKGLRNLQLYTPDGEMLQEADSIPLFGSEAQTGSVFVAGAYEPFIKQTTCATLTATWPKYNFGNHYNTYLLYEQRFCENKLSNARAQVQACLDCIKANSVKLLIQYDKKAIEVAEKKLCEYYNTALNTVREHCTQSGIAINKYSVDAFKLLKTLKAYGKCKGKGKCKCQNQEPKPNGCDCTIPGWYSQANYEVNLSTLVQGQWKPETQDSKLFPVTSKANDNTEVNANSNSITYDFIGTEIQGITSITPDYNMANPPVLDPSTVSGFFKFTLSQPSNPFANQLYTDVLNWVVMKNTAVVTDSIVNPACPPRPIMDLPKLPIVAAMNTLSLHYKFSGITNETKIYALEQNGGENTIPRLMKTGANDDIIERTVNDKTQTGLYLGFDHFPLVSFLTLFFGIAEGDDKNVKNGPDFDLYTRKEWEPVTIASNTTNHWSETGIVTLRIDKQPVRHDLQGEEEPLFWLRMSMGNQKQLKLTMLSINALKVRRVIPDHSQATPKTIPAQTISELLVTLPEIDTIFQPFDSYGYQPKETKPQFRNRVANRLQFKGRASSILACQQLILNHFKSIFQVNIRLIREDTAKTTLEVFIVPWVDHTSNPNAYSPKALPGLVEEVREFLQLRLSSHLVPLVFAAKHRQVRIGAQLTFTSEDNREKLAVQLNEALNNYLSPWLKGQEEQGPVDKLDVDLLKLFVLEKPYVSQVKCLQVYEKGKPKKPSDKAIDETDPCLVFNPNKIETIVSQPKSCLETLENHWHIVEGPVTPKVNEIITPAGPHCIVFNNQ